MISVLSVNYQSAKELAQLAQSIRSHAPAEPVELVVTNNSKEEAINLASDERLPVTIIPSDNVGYGAGINLAFARSRGDLIFVTNPDVRIGPGALQHARRFLDAHPDVGALLPLLRYPDGAIQPSLRRFYTWPVILYSRSPFRAIRLRPRFWLRYLYDRIDRNRPRSVDWGLGAAMFLRRADFGDGPIFDERFFLYFEDVDLCHRIWSRGQRVCYVPRVECVHAHRRESRIPVTRAGWLHFQSMVRFVAKHRGLPGRPRGNDVSPPAAAPTPKE